MSCTVQYCMKGLFEAAGKKLPKRRASAFEAITLTCIVQLLTLSIKSQRLALH